MIPDPDVALNVTVPVDVAPTVIAPSVAFDPRPDPMPDVAPVDRHVIG